MHTAIYYMTLGVVAVTGCASRAGQTKRELAGSLKVVFTNASPQPICDLQMTLEQNSQFGDNWLPAGGVPSGVSIEFKVKPGKYKATWSTCKAHDQPLLAATLIGESSFTLDAQTQLFAYVPDTVPPTKRAATLGREFKLVRFVGQAIETVAEPAKPERVDAFGAAEAELTSGGSGEVKPSKTGAASADGKAAAAITSDAKAADAKGGAVVKSDAKAPASNAKAADAKGAAVVKSDTKAPASKAKVVAKAADAKGAAVVKSDAKAPDAKGAAVVKSDAKAPASIAKADALAAARPSAKGTGKNDGKVPAADTKANANSAAPKPVAKSADPKHEGAAK